MVLGALAFGSGLAGVFFLRFGHQTGDRLFYHFATAFWLLALHWTLLGLTDPSYEHRPILYLLRLAAFVVVLLGIVLKNRPRA
ncbi:MAG: DUF5985 family protein [Candidatus Rokuibacteriota bacterium]